MRLEAWPLGLMNNSYLLLLEVPVSWGWGMIHLDLLCSVLILGLGLLNVSATIVCNPQLQVPFLPC